MSARATVTVALLCAACSVERPVDPCTARLDAIAERLGEAARIADPSGAPPEVSLPRGAGGEALLGTPVLLVVSPDEVRLAGRGVGGAQDDERIATRLAADLRALADTAQERQDSWTVALWIDPAVEVHRLARILSRAPPEVRFALLMRATDLRAPRARGAPSWVRAAVRVRPTMGAIERRDRLDDAWARATETCELAREHLPLPAELAPVGPPMGAPSIDALVGALRRCGCDADLPAMEAVALAALVSADGPLVRVPHALRFGAATGDGRELVLGGDATTQALVERLATITAPPAGEIVWVSAD